MPSLNVIELVADGPLVVEAELHIPGQAPVDTAALCRCGASANKPFCDGSHTDARFEDDGEPETQETEALDPPNGALSVSLSPNGPLVFVGPMEIRSASGRVIDRTERTALCRCGASENKPYCDGSHGRVGFSA